MKHLLKQGTLTRYAAPRGKGGGMSGEVHTLTHSSGTYIVRRCRSVERARLYVSLGKKLEHFGFLPKLLARHGVDVFYEYIPGRNVTKRDAARVAYAVGRIAAQINTVRARGPFNSRFYKHVRELETGTFIVDRKMENARKRAARSMQTSVTPIFTKAEAARIKRAYRRLKQKAKPTLALDMNDTQPANFRITPQGKVYFVDIEAVKPRVKGFGIAKGFLQWFTTPETRRRFLQGYQNVQPLRFFTQAYQDFCYLSFLLQKINYRWKLYNWKAGIQEYEKNMRLFWKIVGEYAPEKD